MILASDVGGTKTRLALYEFKDGEFNRHHLEEFKSLEAAGLAHIAKEYLNGKDVTIEAACFGVPGPVVNGHAKTTNLPWLISEHELSRELGIAQVKLVNDLVSTTASVKHLSSSGLKTIHPGSKDRDTSICTVLAPGTGTGQGFLCSQNGVNFPLPSEGGHVDFAPTNGTEDELLAYLRNKIKGRVSVERVLCGPGLVNIYDFLKHTGKDPEPAELATRIAQGHAASVISQGGISGEFQICEHALNIFCHALGSHAGNMVLSYMATGGVYLGGGIPPKILPKLLEGRFLAGYLNKGRLTDVVKSTPVHVILDDTAALLGAASIAATLLR